MKLRIIAVVIAVGIILASGIQFTGMFVSEPCIKIGFIGPLTGGPSLWGQSSLDMINIAAEEINRNGGINGKRVVIIPEDGKCNSQEAVTAAQKLIHVDGVKFILGGHCSPETAAIAPILEENKVFGLAGISTATGILDDYEFAFRTSPPNLEQARLIAKLSVEKYGIKNIATLTEQTVYAKSITDDFVSAFKELGGNILIEEEFQPNKVEFKTELLKINNKKPDAIFVSPQSPTAGIAIWEEINKLGIDLKLTGNSVFVSKKIKSETFGFLPESAFSVVTFVDPNLEKTKDLINKYRSTYGRDVPYNLFFVGAAYDGVYMLKEALEECGEDPACVKEHFPKIKDWEGSVATFSFKENGDPAINNWRELRIVDGEEVFG